MAVVVISPIPRKRRRTGSGVAMALATLGYRVATGYAKRRERKAKELAAQAEAEKEAAKEAYTMGRQGEADQRAAEDQGRQEKTFAMRETEFAQGQAALPQEATDAEAKRKRDEEDQRLQRQAAGFAAEDQGFDREKHARWRTEPPHAGPKPSETKEKVAKLLDVWSSKTTPAALPSRLGAKLKVKLQGKSPGDDDVLDIVYEELTGAAGGTPLVPKELLVYPELQRAIENYITVLNPGAFFEEDPAKEKKKGFRWFWEKRAAQPEESAYEKAKREAAGG